MSEQEAMKPGEEAFYSWLLNQFCLPESDSWFPGFLLNHVLQAEPPFFGGFVLLERRI